MYATLTNEQERISFCDKLKKRVFGLFHIEVSSLLCSEKSKREWLLTGIDLNKEWDLFSRKGGRGPCSS